MEQVITMYELLGMMAQGTQPDSILFKNDVWFWGHNTYTTFECLKKTPDAQISLFDKYRIDYCLNDKVEIIDSKQYNNTNIKKIEIYKGLFGMEYIEDDDAARCDIKLCDKIIINKLNEIIEHLNK